MLIRPERGNGRQTGGNNGGAKSTAILKEVKREGEGEKVETICEGDCSRVYLIRGKRVEEGEKTCDSDKRVLSGISSGKEEAGRRGARSQRKSGGGLVQQI